jgi:integrase
LPSVAEDVDPLGQFMTRGCGRKRLVINFWPDTVSLQLISNQNSRHTSCTNLDRAGVPQREAMELMHHNDPRLTANTYADVALFSLRGAVAKLSVPSTKHDAQI